MKVQWRPSHLFVFSVYLLVDISVRSGVGTLTCFLFKMGESLYVYCTSVTKRCMHGSCECNRCMPAISELSSSPLFSVSAALGDRSLLFVSKQPDSVPCAHAAPPIASDTCANVTPTAGDVDVTVEVLRPDHQVSTSTSGNACVFVFFFSR